MNTQTLARLAKTCTKCGVQKPLPEFHKDKRVRDGRRSNCKECQGAQKREYNAANRDTISAWQREYRLSNQGKLNAQSREYYADNSGTIITQNRDYRAANPHVTWESCYRRRVVKLGLLPVVESFTRDDLVARYGDACSHCGGPFDELDHYPVPLALGGAHSLDNCRPSCVPCNRSQSPQIRAARARTLVPTSTTP